MIENGKLRIDDCCDKRRRFDDDDCHHERRHKCCDDGDDDQEFEEPLVLAPIVPVAAQSLLITAKADTTTIQILNNPAVLATLTISVATLGKRDKGNLVITDLGGITALTLGNVSGVPTTALAAPASSLSLTWNGYVWVPAV